MNLQQLASEVVYKHRLNQAALGKLVGKSQAWACRVLKGQVNRTELDVLNKLNSALESESLDDFFSE